MRGSKAVPETGLMADPDDVTEDAFLDGAVIARQPRRGHRAGIEAVLMAAAVPLEAGQTLVDIGAGVGVGALCAISRVPAARAVMVETDAGLAGLAEANIARNGRDEHARVVRCDVTRTGAANRNGLAGVADHAMANPPFHDPAASRLSPDKAPAHAAPPEALADWLRFAAAVIRPGGTFTLIHRPEPLGDILAAFGRRFGDLRVCPVLPRPGQAAIRVLVQGVKGSRAPLSLLPALTLHESRGGGFTAEVEAVLRGGAALVLSRDTNRPHPGRPGDLPE